jgi:lysyl oxidase
MTSIRRLGTACILTLLPLQIWSAQPDLIINRARLARSPEVRTRQFPNESCAVEEGCVRLPGARKILLFEVAFSNIGQGDLVIGSPEDQPDLFQYSPCHEHYHMLNAATYQLLTRSGRTVVTGRKQAFCFRDNNPLSYRSPESSGYDCDYMGITAGWEDVYDKSLDCQWLDITGVPPGNYLLKVTVNPRRMFSEGNYANNVTVVPVTIPGARAASRARLLNPQAQRPRARADFRWLFR